MADERESKELQSGTPVIAGPLGSAVAVTQDQLGTILAVEKNPARVQ